MKLLRHDEEAAIFHISKRERVILRQVLDLYPMVPPAHQKVTRDISGENAVEWQRLLDEALAEQRQANKQHLQRWLQAPDRFNSAPSGCELRVERAEVEWLLQVLNDIRVGSWILLGSPEIGRPPADIKVEQMRNWMAMEISGYLQMVLLDLS